MRSAGLTPPAGYPAAINWSRYGSRVRSLREAQPGDVLVYGSNHVAMYLGNGRQIQGNNSDGTVGESGVGGQIGLGPITAIRRPPYKSASGGESPLEAGLHAGLGAIPEGPAAAAAVGGAVDAVGSLIPNPGDVAGEVLSGLTGDLASHAEAFMLNIALLGGGAFLVYYGAALLLGARQPVATPIKAAAEAAAVAPK